MSMPCEYKGYSITPYEDSTGSGYWRTTLRRLDGEPISNPVTNERQKEMTAPHGRYSVDDAIAFAKEVIDSMLRQGGG